MIVIPKDFFTPFDLNSTYHFAIHLTKGIISIDNGLLFPDITTEEYISDITYNTVRGELHEGQPFL